MARRPRESTYTLVSLALAIAAHVALFRTAEELQHGASSGLFARRPPARSVGETVQKLPPEPLLEEKPRLVRLGEKQGEGDSIASVDLPDVQRSPTPDDFVQAWTRQKPVLTPPPAPADPEASPRRAGAATPAQAPPLLLGPSSVRFPPPARTAARAAPQRAEATPAEPGIAAADAPAPTNARPDPAAAGPSDIDPFAIEEGVTFEPGGVAARKGREVKLVRPDIRLGFMADATRLAGQDLVIRLQIETDETGKPRNVEIKRSSGSDVIDDTVRLAMYDSWFGGKMPDKFPFTITFVSR